MTDLMEIFSAFDDDLDIERKALRSPMNYAGSKYSSLKHILPLLPKSDIFVEIFGGSGAVIIAKQPSKVDVFNDRHSGVIALYKCLQDPDKLIQLKNKLELMPHSRELFEDSKSTWKNDSDDVSRAAKYYYSVQKSFSGVGRNWGRVTTNASDSFITNIRRNVELFDLIHNRFRNIQIENLDWRLMLKDYDSHNTVFYLDPPYVDSNEYELKMSRSDHIKMCEMIFNCDGFVALSGFENDIYDKFPWDGVHSWELYNSVSSAAVCDHNDMARGSVSRGKRSEYLWIKEFA